MSKNPLDPYAAFKGPKKTDNWKMKTAENYLNPIVKLDTLPPGYSTQFVVGIDGSWKQTKPDAGLAGWVPDTKPKDVPFDFSAPFFSASGCACGDPECPANKQQTKKEKPVNTNYNAPNLKVKGAMSDTTLEQLILEADIRSQIDSFLEDDANVDKLNARGLRPSRRLLLVGAPGTGKTMTAKALANRLGLPLFVVQLDSLISSYFGGTAQNMRGIFDQIKNLPGVYLFDEADAVITSREMMVGEAARIVNSFLMMMDEVVNKSVIIATTNYDARLDGAAVRRFDTVIRYEPASRLATRSLVVDGFGKYQFSVTKKAVDSSLDTVFSGGVLAVPHSLTTQAIQSTARRAVIDDRKKPDMGLFSTTLRRAVDNQVGATRDAIFGIKRDDSVMNMFRGAPVGSERGPEPRDPSKNVDWYES